MAGFAVLVTLNSITKSFEQDFQNLLQFTAKYKQLPLPPTKVRGVHCLAAKFDAPATLHSGVVRDEKTGSWILAAGTVVALAGDNHPGQVLSRLLRDFLQLGPKALDAYDGHFALVIYNAEEQSLSVVSDPIGLFSIFYCQRGREILISSSAFAIAAQTQPQPDTLAVEHFLRTGRLDADRTLWQDIKRLLGGKVLRVAFGRVQFTEYWSPVYDESVSRLPFAEALEQSVDLLTQTVSRTLPQQEKIWVDLTGGFDSRLVAMLVEKAKVPFSAYCMGPEDHPDVQLSMKIGQEMKWEYVHSQLPEVWGPDQYHWFESALGCGDGRANLLRLAVTMRGFNQRNTAIKTNVMGVGGETWRGYSWQTEKGNIGRTSTLNYPALLDNLFSPGIPLDVMRYDRTQDVRSELSGFIHRLISKYSDLPNTAQIDRFEICRDAGHGGAYISAVAGFERSLAPLCFKAPVNFAFSLNYLWRYPRHHILVRALLERENKRLANLDTTTGGPAIPLRLTNVHRFWPLWKNMTNRVVAIGSKKILGKSVQIWPQPKYTGYPLPAWRASFFDFARGEGLLSPERMVSGGLYNPIEMKKYIEHAEQNTQYSGEFLDRVISVEMAMRAVGSMIV